MWESPENVSVQRSDQLHVKQGKGTEGVKVLTFFIQVEVKEYRL